MGPVTWDTPTGGFDTWASRRAPSPGQTDFDLYVALKLHVYERLNKGGPAAARPDPRSGISSRRIHRLLTNHASNTCVGLFGLTPYFVRERLRQLNHGTVLLRDGRGFRGSQMYRWNEAVEPWTMRAYQHLRRLLPSAPAAGLTLYRLREAFEGRSFGFDDYVRVFRRLRSRLVARRWYSIAAIDADSPHFTRLLRRHLDELVRQGLVGALGEARLQLTPAGVEAAHWIELFAYSAPWQAAADPSIQ